MEKYPFIERLKSPEEFTRWLAGMDRALKGLLSSVPAELSQRLDFSIQSISPLEQWLLDTYPSFSELRKQYISADLPNIEAAGRYVGETFRKSFGGEWYVDLKDLENVILGYPIIVGYPRPQFYATPVQWVTTALSRRTGHFIMDRFDYFAGIS